MKPKSPYQPYRVIKDFNTTAYNNEYMNYTLSFGRWNKDTSSYEQTLIYKGKSLVFDGKTEVDLSPIVRDYSYRRTFEYDDKEGYLPTNIDWVDTPRRSVEMQGDVANTFILINFSYDGVAVTSVTIPFSIYCNDYESPYNNTTTLPQIKLYGEGTIENHIPLCFTTKYYLSFDYAKYNPDGSAITPNLYSEHSNVVDIENTDDYGNYSVSLFLYYILDFLVGNVQTTILQGYDGFDYMYGGTATEYGAIKTPIGATDPDIEDGYIEDQDSIYLAATIDERTPLRVGTLAKVDACPDDWYMAWTDRKGWHSVALDSAWEIDNNEAFNIRNIYDEERNIKNTITRTFRVKTKKLPYEEQLAYMNIIDSAFVLLYNTKTDRNYYCNFITSSADRTKKKDRKQLEFELREIINEIR